MNNSPIHIIQVKSKIKLESDRKTVHSSEKGT